MARSHELQLHFSALQAYRQGDGSEEEQPGLQLALVWNVCVVGSGLSNYSCAVKLDFIFIKILFMYEEEGCIETDLLSADSFSRSL